MSQLIFKILKPSKTFHGIAYNEKKKNRGKAMLLYFDNFGYLMDGRGSIDRKDSKKYLEHFSSSNKRIVNKQFHAIMSCKCQSLSLEQLKDHGLALIERLGYGKNPVLVYGHNDTAHNHIHIITTRVGPDGKKIPHQFERKRANQILSEILNIDRDSAFKQKLSEIDSYSFTTPAQFQLLWELQGYRTKKTSSEVSIYKYSSLMGNVSLQQLQSAINNKKPSTSSIPKIRALIHKYKQQYSTSWLEGNKEKYTTEKKLLQTPLTDFLHQRFGLQFVFFKNPKHDTPYGYAIIDHQNKSVYKGSEVMKLDSLLKADNLQIGKTSDNHSTIDRKEEPKTSPQENVVDHNTTINLGLDYYIDQLEKEAEKEQSHAYDPQRKRRGRFI